MYRGRLWTMRQYAGFGTAAESNARYRYLLSQGVTGLSVAFDLPTQIGYDSDHPLAAGEVGRVGVAIDSIDDMAALFDGIPLDRVSTSMTINATAIILLALYVAVARRTLSVHVYETRRSGKPWYVVVAGPYRDQAAARAAIAGLPKGLSEGQPWLRSVASVHADLRAKS